MLVKLGCTLRGRSTLSTTLCVLITLCPRRCRPCLWDQSNQENWFFPSPVFNLLIKQIKKAVLQPPNLLGPIILQCGYSQYYIWNYIRQFGKKCWFLDPRSRDRGWLLREGPLVIPQANTMGHHWPWVLRDSHFSQPSWTSTNFKTNLKRSFSFPGGSQTWRWRSAGSVGELGHLLFTWVADSLHLISSPNVCWGADHMRGCNSVLLGWWDTQAVRTSSGTCWEVMAAWTWFLGPTGRERWLLRSSTDLHMDAMACMPPMSNVK